MTGNYRYQFLPKNWTFTPNCATLIKMKSNRVHQKISITVKKQNYLDKGQFDQKIGKTLKNIVNHVNHLIYTVKDFSSTARGLSHT